MLTISSVCVTLMYQGSLVFLSDTGHTNHRNFPNLFITQVNKK